ncbi:flagellin [Polymorphobacter multimanifer]|uniref:Flagellin n=2 Tax=Polymorphobacter multimanifer TaxID=1070431 RepID=A0A841LET9_9SPHN|nr:flagellin [Polymorphobacter multimanifer]MBB6227488.1 flagellin [Polymorphobacter multimanifer]
MTVINTNISALTAQSGQRIAGKGLMMAMERLSTGLRINSAKDDAAGLAISQRMTAELRGLKVASRNAQDGISLAQTAESAMSSVSNSLQRMRELSVQSANGIYSATDRAALQVEVKQLIDEIDTVASRTNFNGIKLLDGSAKSLLLQTGSRAGETVKLDIGSARAGSLGTGRTPALTGTGAFEATSTNLTANQAMQAGDLVINGVTIGSSSVRDDNVSSAEKSGSAVARAAAINRATAETGVRAEVGKTVLTGAAMTAGVATGTVTINGITTASITTTANAAESRELVVAAINAIAGQTGVTAIDTSDNNGGIRLEAADGRNVIVSLGTLTSAQTGIKTGAQSGTVSLVSLNGEPISIGTSDSSAARISRSGFSAGSFERGVSTVSSDARAVATGAADARTLNNGDLSINGVAIRGAVSADDTVSSTVSAASVKAGSGIAIAAAINASSAETGVTATANELTLSSSTTAVTLAGAATIDINGVSISITDLAASESAQDRRDKVAEAINDFAGLTGVTAKDNGLGGLDLTAADGRNISLANTGTATSAELGLGGMTIKGTSTSYTVAATAAAANTAYSTVRLESSRAIEVDAGSLGFGTASNFTNLGFEENTYGTDKGGLKVQDLDISTQAGASLALDAIDEALKSVNLDRANLGAAQNRLEATLLNIESNANNLVASRSRITDADFASETTELSRSQVLGQAAQAMLAQANQAGQQVLQLLR